MITIEQCRGARGLLDWTQQDLADASGMSKTAINNFEKGYSDIKNESLRAIRQAFEALDIEFLPDGIRRRHDQARLLKGPNAFAELLEDVADTLKAGGALLIGISDKDLKNRILPEKLQAKLQEFASLNLKARITGHPQAVAALKFTNAETRTLKLETPETLTSVFIYGSKVAFITWGNALITIVNSQDCVTGETARFENLWTASSTKADTRQSAGERT